MLFLGKTTIYFILEHIFVRKLILEMRRVTVSFIISMLFYVHVCAQEDIEVQAISAILGVSDIEETDQYEVERLSVLLDRPLKHLSLMKRFQLQSMMWLTASIRISQAVKTFRSFSAF